MRLFSILSALVCCCNFLHAQYSETISSDRPGQAFSPSAVGNRTLQFQYGVNYAGTKIANSRSDAVTTDLVLRYGIVEQFEINTTVLVSKYYPSFFQAEVFGVEGFQVGMRYNIFSGTNKQPTVGVQTSIILPATSGDFYTTETGLGLLFSLSQPIADWLNLTLNGSATWQQGFQPAGSYVVNLTFATGDKVSVFVEHYATVYDKEIDFYVDGGIAYLINNNLQLDISAGGGKNDSPAIFSPEVGSFFASAGVSWRFRHGQVIGKKTKN